MGEMLEWAHGKANLVHAGWHYDPTKTDKDNYDASRWDISFPGLLDAETINTLLMNGFMWGKCLACPRVYGDRNAVPSLPT